MGAVLDADSSVLLRLRATVGMSVSFSIRSLGAIVTESGKSLLQSCRTRPHLPAALNPVRVIVIACVTSQ